MSANDQVLMEVIKNGAAMIKWLRLSGGNRATLTGTYTMDHDDVTLQVLDPGGGARDVLLPTEKDGVVFIIANNADAAEALTVKDDGNAVTLATLSQDDVGIFISDGTGWAAFKVAGVVT